MEQFNLKSLEEATKVLETPRKIIDKIKMTSAYYEKLRRQYNVIELNEIGSFGMLGVKVEIDDTLKNEYEIEYKTLTN